MHKFLTIAGALALGAVWSVGPALAADAADKIESAKDKVETKTEKAADKMERAADKAADKTEHAKDTVKDKAIRAKDTIKDKAERTKDKMKAKMDTANERMVMTDARAAQQALKMNGFDPGPIDGRVGPRTRAAILDYQKKNDLPVTGMLDEPTIAKLNVRSERTDDVPAASPTTQPDPKKQTQ